MKRLYSLKKILLLTFILLGCSLQGRADDFRNGLLGFATVPAYGLDGTYGGALGETVYATTESQLRAYCKASQAYTILFEGTISLSNEQDITVTSNKSIIGLNGNAVLEGIGFTASGVSNVIIRGFTIRKAHQDAIAFRSSHHVWVDHCDLSDSDDGLLDFTIGSDFLTASWNYFHNHDKTSICNSGTQHYEDVGKERVSYHHNAFVDNVQRNPRVGYGKGHVWNNYYENISSYCVGYFTGAQVLVENNYFYKCKTPLQQMYSSDASSAHYGQAQEKGNVFVSCSGNTKGTGTVFSPANYYNASPAMDAAKDVASKVKNGMGPKAGLEYDLIPLPNNGRIDFPQVCPTLRWSQAPKASAYRVYLSPAVDSLNIIAGHETVTNAYTCDSLQASTTYYWRVDAVLADTVLQGAVWQFTTAAPAAGKPYPSNGNSNADVREQKDATNTQALTLTWSPAFGAASYDVSLSSASGNVAYTATLPASQCSWQPKSLPRGEKYTWHVDALDKDGNLLQAGDEWAFKSVIASAVEGKNEAENWTRGLRAFVEVPGSWFDASGKKVVGGESGPGTLNAQWKGQHVNASISVCIFDESDGKGLYKLFINDVQQGSFTASTNNDKLCTYTICKSAELCEGDQLRLEFSPEGGEGCRTDYINIAVNSVIDGLPLIEGNNDSQPVRYFDVLGRPVQPGDGYRGLLIGSDGSKTIIR